MPEAVPFDSVASLLEQILAVEKEILANVQTANSTLNALFMNAQALTALTRHSLAVAEATLESSHRIEQLLGGTGPAVPTEIKVTYQYTMKGKENA